MIRRREFIAGLGSVAPLPVVARAQPFQHRERTKCIGMLLYVGVNDPESSDRLAAVAQGVQELGWIVGRNVRIDTRFGAADLERSRSQATELVALGPDVILASGAPSVIALLRRPAACPSYSRTSSIPLAAALSTALRGLAVMPPGFHCSNIASAENG